MMTLLRSRSLRTAVLATAAGLLVAAGPPDDRALDAAPVADPDLAEMRGGIRLPNGIDAAVAVSSDTLVNGNLVLRSTFRVVEGPATISVFVPRDGETVQGSGAPQAGAAGPTIRYDRLTGLTVIPGNLAGGSAIRVTSGASGPAGADDRLQQIAVDRGQAVQTAGGTVSLDQTGRVDRVRLQNETLDASHLYGGAYGSLTTNTASDVTLDTVTSVSIELRNVSADTIGSSLLRAEDLSLQASRQLAGGGL